MPKRLVNITFILVIFHLSSIAQLYKNVDIITTDHGLSQNAVTAVIQDSKGFIWIGTNDGLNRYDGYEFKIYKNDFYNENSLSDNVIMHILEDGDNLWIGTGRGLSKLNLRNNRFEQNILPDEMQMVLNDLTVSCLELDGNRNLWIGTRSGIFKLSIDSNEFTDFSLSTHPLSKLKDEFITSIITNGKTKLYIGSSAAQNPVYAFNTITKDFFEIYYPHNGPVGAETKFLELESGEILIGKQHSEFYLLNPNEDEITTLPTKDEHFHTYFGDFINYSENNILFSLARKLYSINLESREINPIPGINFQNITTTMHYDKSGVLWVGTNGRGIYKIVLRRSNFTTVLGKNDINKGFTVSSVRTMLVDSKNKLWVGGHTALDTCTYSPGNFQGWGELVEFNDLNIYSIIQDPLNENVFWIGTENSGLIKYNTLDSSSLIFMRDVNKDLIDINTVYKLFVASTRIIYIGTKKGLIIYNPFTREFDKRFINAATGKEDIIPGEVKAIYEDSKGLIWIGSAYDGIAIYDPETEHIKTYNTNSKEYPVNGNRINTFCEQPGNIMWIGTGNGLNKFDLSQDRITVFSLNEIPSNNYVYGILSDNEGNIWFSTNRGINKFNPQTEKLINFDQGHGLQSNEFNTVAFYKYRNGEMFFGGINGFSSFFPEKIQMSKYQPDVIFTKFKKSNKEFELPRSITYTDTLRLTYKDRFFSISFASTDFVNPGKVRFRYMLEGFSDDWIYTDGVNNSAGYTNIGPGFYKLRVVATNSDGVLSPREKELNIKVEPAFWQTLWFKISIITLIIFISWLIINSRFRVLKKEKDIQQKLHEQIISIQEEERKCISSELHDDLGQNLLVVKNKLLLSERDQSKQQFSESLDILNETIRDISKLSHSLHPTELEELGLTRAIEVMTSRIKSSTDLSFKVNLQYIDQFFAKDQNINIYRVFQEALNNIIKHADASEVEIMDTETGYSLFIMIKDNGKGFDIKQQSGKQDRPQFGISGMKERLKIVNGKFIIKSHPGWGTEIILEFIK